MVQTAAQITGLLSANSTCAFSLHGDHKARKCQREVSKLKQDSKRQAFINDICSRLDAMELRSDDPEENWTVFRDTVHFSAMDSIGPVSLKTKTDLTRMTKKFRDSLKRNTKKHKTYLCDTSPVSNKAAYSNICKTVQLGSEICKTPG